MNNSRVISQMKFPNVLFFKWVHKQGLSYFGKALVQNVAPNSLRI